MCLSFSGVVTASPILPCEFYGTVLIDGVPAPIDTEIIAYIGDRVAGLIIVEEPGIYGGTGTFDTRLVVITLEEELSDDTAVIRFATGDRFADQSFIFETGHSTELNLTFTEGPDDGVTMMNAEASEEVFDDVTSESVPSEDTAPEA